MISIKNVTCYRCELSIFLSSFCALYCKKTLNQKLSFNLLKNKHFFKIEEKAF
jgi:hypothetical protein